MGAEDGKASQPLWAFVFLVFLVAVPALVIGALAFSKLPSDCAAPSSELTVNSTAKPASSAHWDYSDTGNWGNLDGKYATCGTGKRQSPINIMSDAKIAAADETTISMADFQDGSMLMKNAFSNKATMTHNGHAVGANGMQGFFKHNNKWYKLLQFHFHTPSEHTVDGFSFAAEAHFVHQDATGAYLVIAVLFNTDNDVTHASMKEILEDFPMKVDEPDSLKTFNYTAALEYIVGESVNSTGTVIKGGTAPFYTYSGSFTTPPCTEDIKWIVLRTPKAMSSAHIVKLKTAMGANNRPVTPLNDRVVTAKS